MEGKSWPFESFCLHSSEGHICSGVNCLAETGWKISQPQRSQVYAWIRMLGFKSDTLVVMPRTVIKWPKCSPRTCRTARVFLLASAPVGVTGLKFSVYLLVNSAGKVDTGTAASASASAAEATVSFRFARCAIMMSRTSSLNLRACQKSNTHTSLQAYETSLLGFGIILSTASENRST